MRTGRKGAGGWRAWSAGLTAALLAISPALGKEGGDEANPAVLFFRWLEGGVGTSAAAIIIVIALPALGAALKWLLDEVKATNAKRREFVARTSEKVVDLAWTHYWGLANATGTLAGRLTQHLRMVDAHLLVIWGDPGALRQRTEELAKETADASFASFVRLLYAFERFQFRGSNTYLLPHHAAGETLRRLYNRFVESLDTELVKCLPDVRLAIERKLTVKDKEGRDDPRLDLGSAQFETIPWFTADGIGTAAADLTDATLERALRPARQRYEAWLATQPAAVAEAADTLRAFSRLLTHELASLHAVWHRDKGPFALSEAWRQAQAAVIGHAWPGVLDENSVETIRRARSISPFFTPLGMGARAEQPPRPEAQPVEAPAAAPAPPAAAGAFERRPAPPPEPAGGS
ncbi:MAG: hypothetical protein MUC89_10755 [Acetobacteraceae bacterium]|jgi:hypothetical protein|nr:hypothetical protein [Acetobacteraceae bacterium]